MKWNAARCGVVVALGICLAGELQVRAQAPLRPPPAAPAQRRTVDPEGRHHVVVNPMEASPAELVKADRLRELTEIVCKVLQESRRFASVRLFDMNRLGQPGNLPAQEGEWLVQSTVSRERGNAVVVVSLDTEGNPGVPRYFGRASAPGSQGVLPQLVTEATESLARSAPAPMGKTPDKYQEQEAVARASATISPFTSVRERLPPNPQGQREGAPQIQISAEESAALTRRLYDLVQQSKRFPAVYGPAASSAEGGGARQAGDADAEWLRAHAGQSIVAQCGKARQDLYVQVDRSRVGAGTSDSAKASAPLAPGQKPSEVLPQLLDQAVADLLRTDILVVNPAGKLGSAQKGAPGEAVGISLQSDRDTDGPGLRLTPVQKAQVVNALVRKVEALRRFKTVFTEESFKKKMQAEGAQKILQAIRDIDDVSGTTGKCGTDLVVELKWDSQAVQNARVRVTGTPAQGEAVEAAYARLAETAVERLLTGK
jgi:hypothetical protein